MKIALITLTPNGIKIAARIKHIFPEADVFTKDDLAVSEDCSLKKLVKDIFSQYDGLIFIMATGIVVRVVAPFIEHKSIDPAIVVIDEQGNFVISLLSGHLGGANELTQNIAEKIRAIPVITTATDVNGLPAIDMLAKKLKLAIDNYSGIKHVNAAIVNKQKVVLFSEINKAEILKAYPLLDQKNIIINTFDEYQKNCNDLDLKVIISRKLMDGINTKTLILRPQDLSIGIGCRRDTEARSIIEAIKQACRQIQISEKSIGKLTSAWVKADEEGIIIAAKHFKVPFITFEREELANAIQKYNLKQSPFVSSQLKVGAVSEPAAILGSAQGKLLQARLVINNITVAIAM